ncbi:Macro domain-containing protein [Phytophthora cinnamomi]|uniref:Macro domain-containing protein n=1 Tax=Phytophthora cinnamomi TaxID=4785 RepID=UPI00355A8CB4|nr:Macro domain-containing protein [Phytophthora cinnamomi]
MEVPPPVSSGMELWAVEDVAHCVLRCFDLSTLDAVLHFVQAAPELHGYLQDSSLWSELRRRCVEQEFLQS